MEPNTIWTGGMAVLGIWAVTVMTPGPNFVATVHTAGSVSWRHGVLVALGISVGTAIWATVSLVGLGVLFQTASGLYNAVKWIGAAYLVLVGVRMMLVRERNDPAAAAARRPTGWTAFRLGLFTDLANPKAAAYFASLFAVAVPPAAPLAFHAFLVVGVVIIAGGWYALAALVMGRPRVAAAYRRFRLWITRIAGACFVGFGARLVV